MKVALLVLSVCASSCAAAPIPRIGGDAAPAVSDAADEAKYQSVLEAHTKSQAIYDNLDQKCFVHATIQSPQYVEARLAREAVFRSLPADEIAKARAAEQVRLSDATEFMMGTYTADFRWDDFQRPNSMWRIALVVGERELTPTSVTRVGRATADLRSFYPYLESFWVAYRVRFPKIEARAGETIRLKLSSSLGRAELPFIVE